MTESDGEVSQFDSLDNCSDGGMSAENFNTLKKGPLAPIDPPPQFQVLFIIIIYYSISRNFINLFYKKNRTHRSPRCSDHRNCKPLLRA